MAHGGTPQAEIIQYIQSKCQENSKNHTAPCQKHFLYRYLPRRPQKEIKGAHNKHNNIHLLSGADKQRADKHACDKSAVFIICTVSRQFGQKQGKQRNGNPFRTDFIAVSGMSCRHHTT